MKQYDIYKDSGIQWIGKIPSHWEVKKLKYLADQSQRDSFMDGDWIESPYISDYGIRYLTTGNIGDGNYKEQGNGHITHAVFDELGCKFAYPGDLVFSRLNAPYGRSCILPNTEERFVLAVDNVILRTKHNKKFICYCSQCELFHRAVEDYASGTTMKRISRSNLGRLPVIVPPIAEQEKIAAWLDWKVGQIDAIVTEKEAVVTDMQSYRQSLISETVTRGLNPDVPLRPSGINWFGDIPQHWQVFKVKYFAQMQSGDNITSEDIKESGEYPVYGGNGLRGYYDAYNTEGDFVLVGRQGALAGNIHRATGRFWATDHAVVSKIDSLCDVGYVAYLFESMNFNQYAFETSAQPGLAVSKIQNLLTVCPPLAEQKAIADFIDDKTAQIDSIIADLQTQITDLRSYKASLISEAVTGKVDLRDVTIPEHSKA